MAFNYEDKSLNLTDEFKKQYIVNIKGKDAIKVEGLVVLAHDKGMWKMDTEIIQYPSEENKWTAICKCTVGGYDWDPIKKEIREVEYSDIADANEANCTSMVAKSYIRMASTRAIGRALRKYTNCDMLCSSELSEVVDTSEPTVSVETLTSIKKALHTHNINEEIFNKMLASFGTNKNVTQLTVNEGNKLLNMVENYIPPQSNS